MSLPPVIFGPRGAPDSLGNQLINVVNTLFGIKGSLEYEK